MPSKRSSPPNPDNDLTQLAESYLDFWQDNLMAWATDINALTTWAEELAQQALQHKSGISAGPETGPETEPETKPDNKDG